MHSRIAVFTLVLWSEVAAARQPVNGPAQAKPRRATFAESVAVARLQRSGLIDVILARFNPKVTVVVKSCPNGAAFYEGRSRQVVVCASFVAALDALSGDSLPLFILPPIKVVVNDDRAAALGPVKTARLKKTPVGPAPDSASFNAAIQFVLLHELAHALIAELRAATVEPELAADGIAMAAMIEWYGHASLGKAAKLLARMNIEGTDLSHPPLAWRLLRMRCFASLAKPGATQECRNWAATQAAYRELVRRAMRRPAVGAPPVTKLDLVTPNDEAICDDEENVMSSRPLPVIITVAPSPRALN